MFHPALAKSSAAQLPSLSQVTKCADRGLPCVAEAAVETYKFDVFYFL